MYHYMLAVYPLQDTTTVNKLLEYHYMLVVYPLQDMAIISRLYCLFMILLENVTYYFLNRMTTANRSTVDCNRSAVDCNISAEGNLFFQIRLPAD